MKDKNTRIYLISLVIFTLIVGSLPYITLQTHFYFHDNHIGANINLYLLSSFIRIIALICIIIYNSIHTIKLFKRDNRFSYYTFVIFISFVPIWYIIALIYTKWFKLSMTWLQYKQTYKKTYKIIEFLYVFCYNEV